MLEDTVRETRVTIDDSQIPGELRRFIVECTTAAMISVGKDLVWSEPPLRHVSFRFSAPGTAERYEQFYGAKPSFNSSANVLALDRARLELPLPQANEHVLRLAEEHCRKLLEMGRSRTGLASRVRVRLEARMKRMPDMEEVADALHLTVRTLRRRLGKRPPRLRSCATRCEWPWLRRCLPDRVFRWSRSRSVWAMPTRRASSAPSSAAGVALLAAFDRKCL